MGDTLTGHELLSTKIRFGVAVFLGFSTRLCSQVYLDDRATLLGLGFLHLPDTLRLQGLLYRVDTLTSIGLLTSSGRLI